MLKKSSSGGAFCKISDEFLVNGGVVCGAAFDNNFIVKHQIAKNKTERDMLCGSKYIPSDLGETFRMVSDNLVANKLVLFSGTPCQCNALINYLRSKKVSRNNLLIVDFLCHGSGNAIVWEQHKKLLEKSHGKIDSFTFRDKNKSWERYPTKAIFRNGKESKDGRIVRMYTILFLNQYINIDLCYHCPYRDKHFADITMSDYWNVKKDYPALYNSNGVSALYINTAKGHYYIKKILTDEFTKIKTSIGDSKIERHKEQNMSSRFWKLYDIAGYAFTAKVFTFYDYYRSKLSSLLRRIAKY